MTKNPELIMRRRCERVACQLRLGDVALSQVREESGRAGGLRFPRAPSRAIRIAVKRGGPAAKSRGGTPPMGVAAPESVFGGSCRRLGVPLLALGNVPPHGSSVTV